MDIDTLVLCPRSEKAEEKEQVLQAVCGVLAFLIVVTLTKLLYDYWNYRKRGKLPWIVNRMAQFIYFDTEETLVTIGTIFFCFERENYRQCKVFVMFLKQKI